MMKWNLILLFSFSYFSDLIGESSFLVNSQSFLLEDLGVNILDIDFCETHMVLILKEGKSFRLCSIPLPLSVDGKVSYDSANSSSNYKFLRKY